MQKNTSLGESMTISTKKTKVECEEKIKLNIPQKIWSDIHYLHSKYPGEEWSGYIYFRPIGTIDKPSELIINLEEFVLMDLGTVGATEITPSGEQVVDMYDKRPQLIELKQALVHTHHNMNVFFSGTDWDTLLEHASAYPYFLSLIVNTKGDVIAKVALQGFKESIAKYSYKFNRGFVDKVPVTEKIEIIYVHDCIIHIENNVDEEFNKLSEIKKEKEIARNLSVRAYTGNHTTGYIQKNYKNNFFDDDNSWDIKPKNSQFKLPLERPIKRDTKGRTIEFLTSCILQDESCLRCETINYTQAKEEWDETVGVDLSKEYSEYVEAIIEDVFYTIFSENYTQEEIKDIKTHIAVIIGKHPSEIAIKPIIDDLLETLTVQYE